ncbi:MAG TPA: DUF6666 family protein, partial [Nitrospiraceae bacterium]|nr:DUF6666 family protein [Nitrospiraceae bacterium]
YEVTQLRGEASWVFPCAHELGFWFTAALDEDTATSTFDRPRAFETDTFEPIDLYAFFYRHRFADASGAQARFYAGFTGDSDGLIGGDLRLPLSCDFSLECAFTYLVPEEATAAVPIGGHQEEAWNVSIGFVWYPGARTAIDNDYFRPLFNVADNGSFITGLR